MHTDFASKLLTNLFGYPQTHTITFWSTFCNSHIDSKLIKDFVNFLCFYPNSIVFYSDYYVSLIGVGYDFDSDKSIWSTLLDWIPD